MADRRKRPVRSLKSQASPALKYRGKKVISFPHSAPTNANASGIKTPQNPSRRKRPSISSLRTKAVGDVASLPTCAQSPPPPILGLRNGGRAIVVPDEARLDLLPASGSLRPANQQFPDVTRPFLFRPVAFSRITNSACARLRERIDSHAKWENTIFGDLPPTITCGRLSVASCLFCQFNRLH